VYPTSFASVYWLSSRLSSLLRLSPDAHAEVLIAAPKATQAIFAAVGDYYTWKLGEKVYGEGSNEAWAAVCSIHSNQERIFIIEWHLKADVRSIGPCSSPWLCAVLGNGFVPHARFRIAWRLPTQSLLWNPGPGNGLWPGKIERPPTRKAYRRGTAQSLLMKFWSTFSFLLFECIRLVTCT